MTRTRVGILRGGTSSEYSQSLKTGAAMLAALPEDRYDVRDIFIDKQGIWHVRGVAQTPVRATHQLDVVLNALHGGMGEDGTVQRFLESNGIPYAGARPPAASLSMNKARAHEVLEAAGVLMPHAILFSLNNRMNTAQMAQMVFGQFSPPYIVKAPMGGGSVGIRTAASIVALPDAIGDILDLYGSAIVEEFIRGDHVNTAVIEGFRNEDLYVLPPSEQLIPVDATDNTFGSRIIEPRHIESATITHICPTDFSRQEKTAIANTARLAHRTLGMRHFSHIDMMRTPHGIYVLEVDSVPALHEGSSMLPMLDSVGSSVPQFLEHAITLARQ